MVGGDTVVLLVGDAVVEVVQDVVGGDTVVLLVDNVVITVVGG